ncbi:MULTISPECIES: TRAP transporter small permease [Halopseudomonas]|uniref:TRAP transporter small permease protein n=1 Tax=Halopseudomonas bauzanensis TaxID=653930 RepID=A0A031MFT5_9GAMM|nr:MULTISPECIES: TRAP transporter small permease [Halopseudomonas]EZQ19452.1 C4-dicarboxylate ABC transporter [Halopseudomonas bauzanensis]TKA93143.1 TRAP transporter small permease [Halopseudomonas bauzanensis]WGK61408.1 TRAP transporter small permease [Halopseudomonas sp. SMJS2]SES02278.1 C4-dicarboxylate transporter, DctQ subunit [Halopseudomonas bauzanensis]SFM03164.1 C4-dicarboxylate transporter, DctQ subunit [Halopseudomonas bauzanensis]
MHALRLAWDHFEEGVIVFLLTAMTLVTFVYVIINNLYNPFFLLGDFFEIRGAAGISAFFFAIGDFIIYLAQEMTWGNALSKALFAWLIFFGLAYGVRTAGHIGVDALVRLTSQRIQWGIGILACMICLGYAGLLSVASFEWVVALFGNAIYADDLDQFGIRKWHVALIVPLGFTMMFIRFAEILIRILRHQQTGLGLADEAAEAAKLADSEDRRP